MDFIQELEKRVKKDQKLLELHEENAFFNQTQENIIWLKQIIKQEKSWTLAEKYGEKAELYVWLIVQHAQDVQFQEKYLKMLKKLPKTKERKKHIAYLTDKILIQQKKEQLYGTQFKDEKPYPIFQKKKLNSRRKEMGLNQFD